MPILYIILGAIFVILLYIGVAHLDRSRYKRQHDIIRERQARLDARAQEAAENEEKKQNDS